MKSHVKLGAKTMILVIWKEYDNKGEMTKKVIEIEHVTATEDGEENLWKNLPEDFSMLLMKFSTE